MTTLWIGFNDAGRRIGEGHPRAKYTDEEIEWVHHLHEQGLTAAQIAVKMDMPAPTVRSYLSGSKRGQAAVKWKRRRFEER